MNPGIELRKARSLAGLSQRELANRAHIPQSTIARIESGVMNPTVDTFENLLQLCGHRLTLSRLGEGIDRTVMRELIKESPSKLLDRAKAEAAVVEEMLEATRW